MGDSFELLEQEILAKRIELENAGDTIARDTAIGELGNLYAYNLNHLYFSDDNEDLTHAERFIELIREEIANPLLVSRIAWYRSELETFYWHVSNVIYRSTDLALVQKFVRIIKVDYDRLLKRIEEQGTASENEAFSRSQLSYLLGTLRYKYYELLAVTKSMQTLINEFTFAFNTRFKLEKDKNLNVMALSRQWAEGFSPSAGDSRYLTFVYNIGFFDDFANFENFGATEIFFSTAEHPIRANATIEKALAKAVRDEIEAEWLLVIKYEQLTIDFDNALTERNSEKYFHAKSELERYDLFVKKT